MRYIIVPPTVILRNPRTKQPFEGEGVMKTFLDYAFEVWFNDPRVSKNGPVKLRRWMKMVDVFEKYCNPGDVVVLDEEDWKQLKVIVEQPEASFPPLIAYQFDAFSSAVLDAPDVDPRSAASAEPSAN